MALILSLETTTKVCSVAITRNGELLALVESNDADYGHAEKLHVYIDEALEKAGISIKQLQAIAVAGGPGSYTGLRIGVSAAKGFCFGLELPLIAVDPLKALVHRFKASHKMLDEGLIMPMIDARRDEVFMAAYTETLTPVLDTCAQIIDPAFFEKYAPQTCYLIGDGAAKFADMFQENTLVKIVPECLASAAFIGLLAEEQFSRNDFVDLVYYEPFYGKEFQTTVSTKLNKVRTSN